MGQIIVKIDENSNRVQVIEHKTHGDTVKYVKTSDFVAAVTKYDEAANFIDVTQPEGCVSAKINRRGDMIAEFVVLGRIRSLFYGGDEYRIPMPTLHFRFSSSEAKRDGYCWVECDGKQYLYPFGNVDTASKICFGNIQRKRAESFSDFLGWINQFFAAKTNDDYYSGKSVILPETGESLEQRDLLSRLQEMQSFPVEWLRATKIL